MKKIIVVLGMHRSGTSALTRGLKLLGVELGDRLMDGVAGENEKGFWEDTDFYKINEQLLSILRSSWDGLRELDFQCLNDEKFSNLKNTAKELLEERLKDGVTFGFKDPRTSVLLPFWQQIFYELGIQEQYVIVVRNPVDVALSLESRNSFPKEKSFYLWAKHICSSLENINDKSTVIVSFNKLLDNPTYELKRVAKALELNFTEDKHTIDVYENEFLSKKLRHHDSSFENNDSHFDDLPTAILELYRWIEKFAETDIERARFLPTDEWKRFSQFVDIPTLLNLYDEALIESSYLVQEKQTLKQTFESEKRTLENEKRALEDEKRALEDEKRTIENAKEAIEQQAQILEQEKQALQGEIQNIFSMLYQFRISLLGSFFTTIEKIYLKLRRSSDYTAYGHLMNIAMERNQGQVSQKKPSGKIRLIYLMISYVFKHPRASLRFLSFESLSKVFKVLLSRDKSQVASWVSMRFPQDSIASFKPVTYTDEAALKGLHLTFPVFETTKLSIIVPVYNQYETTVSCLKAVLENTQNVNYELIIGDDCSSDLTCTIEERIKNIKVIKNEKNLGFLQNCNNAASYSSGEFIVLLNNDTNVQKGWAEALLGTIEADNKVGLVGPKLVYENGVLQEAGGIIWQDGSGWNYGRGQDALAPEFNYLRETDYISGACILLRKSTWDLLGGFDKAFTPAYYEDTDIAFEVRKLGLKVVYQPESVVVHFEGVSNGTEVTSGVKRYQQINQKVFAEKWQDELKHHFPNAENVFMARERSKVKTTVLFIDHYVPFYDKDAGSRSTYLYIKSMIDLGINVKFLPANFFPHQPYTQHLQQLGVEVLHGEHYAVTWKNWLIDNAENIDVIYMHRPHITEQFLETVLSLTPRPKLIYFGHDLHYLRTNRELELGESESNNDSLRKEAEKWKKLEFNIIKSVDITFFPSEFEVSEVKRELPGAAVKALPLYCLEDKAPEEFDFDNRTGLIFVGGYGHPPNLDGIKWFINDIFPLILKENSEIKLHLVGSNVPDELHDLASESIIVHGFLTDDELDELYNKVRVSIIPLRFGAGVKGKLLEAIQIGLPIVTTSIGAEGIPDVERITKVRDDKQTFANDVLSFYESESECVDYTKRYAEYINNYFSKDVVDTFINNNFKV